MNFWSNLKKSQKIKISANYSFAIYQLFQTFNLIRDLTALENVALVQELSGKVDLDAAKDFLRQVGLDGMENRFPFELSGGQQQRISIARSMAKKPKVLLADEPTGNLDEKTTHEVFQTLVEMCKKNSITIIVVSHDLSLSKYTSKIIEMRSGKTVDKS